MAWKPDYITLEQARNYLGVPPDNTDDDTEIAGYITAASRAIDNHCNRQFGLLDTAAARMCQAEWRSGSGRWVVPIPDLMTDVGLVVTVDPLGTPSVAAAVRLEPVDAAFEGRPWTRIVLADGFPTSWPDACFRDVEVTARFGWSAVPAAVVFACKLQVSRFAARRESPLGVAGSPDLGSEIRLLSKVDPDVGVSLAAFVKPRRPQ